MLLPLVALSCHRLPPDYMKLVIGAYAFCVRSLLIAIHKNLEIAHFFCSFCRFPESRGYVIFIPRSVWSKSETDRHRIVNKCHLNLIEW